MVRWIARWREPANANASTAGTAHAGREFSNDGRSKRLVFVAHCVLNQNARDEGSADFPAMMTPLVAALQNNDIGIIQLPCPELMTLGFGRGREMSPLRTIRDRLELPESQVRLARLVDDVIHQVMEYQAQGFHVIGILGKNGSPTCGVQKRRPMNVLAAEEGVFVRLLRKRLDEMGLSVGIAGIDDHRPDEAIEWVLKRK